VISVGVGPGLFLFMVTSSAEDANELLWSVAQEKWHNKKRKP